MIVSVYFAVVVAAAAVEAAVEVVVVGDIGFVNAADTVTASDAAVVVSSLAKRASIPVGGLVAA